MSDDHGSTLLAFRGEDDAPSDPRARRRRSRARRALAVALGLIAVLALITVAGAYVATERVAGHIGRIPRAFEGLPEQSRPDKPSQGSAGADGVTFLLAGSDRRSDVPTTGSGAQANAWVPGAQRADAIMLVHLTGDRKHAYVVSIPRDVWTTIPGYGKNKINAAFSFGGPSLYVNTVERLTHIRMDHLALIDWSGFTRLTNALGGVPITFGAPEYDEGGNLLYPAGTHVLNGDQALTYVRARHNLPRGDLSRVQRQQNFLRSVLSKLLSSDTLHSPTRLARVATTIGDSVSVDDALSNADLVRLALSARNLRQSDVTFMTVPITGFAMIGGQSVDLLDQRRAAPLWAAIRNDRLPAYIAKYGADKLPKTPA